MDGAAEILLSNVIVQVAHPSGLEICCTDVAYNDQFRTTIFKTVAFFPLDLPSLIKSLDKYY